MDGLFHQVILPSIAIGAFSLSSGLVVRLLLMERELDQLKKHRAEDIKALRDFSRYLAAWLTEIDISVLKLLNTIEKIEDKIK